MNLLFIKDIAQKKTLDTSWEQTWWMLGKTIDFNNKNEYPYTFIAH